MNRKLKQLMIMIAGVAFLCAVIAGIVYVIMHDYGVPVFLGGLVLLVLYGVLRGFWGLAGAILEDWERHTREERADAERRARLAKDSCARK